MRGHICFNFALDLIIFKPILGCVYHFYNVHHLLAPPTVLEHFFGHCETLPGLKEPSWTIMDPKRDTAKLISGDPW